MTEQRLDLAVIESRWWDESNDSVRGVFDTLAGMLVDNPFGYHYEMFNNAASIKEMVPRLADSSRIHHIYVAAHGDEKGIFGAGKKRISWTIIQNLLENIHSQKLHGLFFGSCKFGENIDQLIQNTGLTWIAGYNEEVDWIHALAMDLFYWHAYYLSSVVDATRKEERVGGMESLLGALWIRVPYMFQELGFRVALAYRGEALTFPDHFLRENGEPKDFYVNSFRNVEELVNHAEPGLWP